MTQESMSLKRRRNDKYGSKHSNDKAFIEFGSN